MLGIMKKYMMWLHTQWPAGVVEKLPQVNPDGSTNVAGLYITGDLTGIPLLKFSSDGGARAVQTIVRDNEFQKLWADRSNPEALDLVIIGAGVSGMAAALEARKSSLTFEIVEATEPFSTVVNFPKGKPIFTYPTEMIPAGDLQFTATIKEPLVEELKAQTLKRGLRPRMARAERVARKGKFLEVIVAGGQNLLARRVIVAIGRSGNFRKLHVPGEDRDKVYNRLHDPKDFCDKNALVVGGGDTAMETAIALALCGASITLSYRKSEFTRPKPENLAGLKKLMADPMADVAVETPASERITTCCGGFMKEHRKPGHIHLLLGSKVKSIGETDVTLTDAQGKDTVLPNDAVFTMIGREAPLDFFRRSGVRITGEMGVRQWGAFAAFFLFCLFLYNWKAGGDVSRIFSEHSWFPYNVPTFLKGWGGSIAAHAANPKTFLGTLTISLTDPGFYYSLAYTLLIVIFGFRRIQRRKTPYVTAQTFTLMAIQVLPLFLLPTIILPYLGHLGAFDSGIGKSFADALFPLVNYGQGREYWRSFGFILAWPLFLYNVFTAQPLWWWFWISVVQTFVILPAMIYFWGKGAYCGWICSCGAMAETMGDTHRHKMPHGSKWNRVNMVGQVILAAALLLFVARVISWQWPAGGAGRFMSRLFAGLLDGWKLFGIQLNYHWMVDVFLAGVVGLGAYFWFSGRTWCRFACPLAALMHLYARFSRFRIIPEKKKCISCNLCTSVCHLGIDIMNFANKGLLMADPECVRCSACVQSCPTGVLQFGQTDRKTGKLIQLDALPASPVLMAEKISH